MEQNDLQINDAAEVIYSAEQEQEIMNNELATLPENEKKEMLMVAKPHDLVIIDTHKKKITSFKKKYPLSKFQFTEGEPFDKEKHKKVLSVWQEIKNWRTKQLVPQFKELKSPFNTVLNYYIKAEKDLTAELKKIEDPIGDIVDKWEKLEKDEKEKEAKAIEIRSNKRVNELIAAGMSFDNEYYSIGSEEFEVATISLGMSDINSMTDESYNFMLEQAKEKSETIRKKQAYKDAEALRKENEKIAADQLEKDNLKKEQEKLAEQQNQLKEKNARIRGKELKLLNMVLNEQWNVYLCGNVKITVDQVENSSDEDWEGLISDAEHKIETEKQKIKKQKSVETREVELSFIGLKKTPTGYISSYKNDTLTVNTESIVNADELQWNKIISDAKIYLNQQKETKLEDEKIFNQKKELAKERETILAPYWQFVTAEQKALLGDYSNEEFEFMLGNTKIANENNLKLKKQQKEDADKIELTKKGDKAMYDDYIKKLQQIELPAVTTKEYKDKVNSVSTFLEHS